MEGNPSANLAGAAAGRAKADSGTGAPPSSPPLPPDIPYWTLPEQDCALRLGSGPSGLTAAEAEARLRRFGPNAIESRRESQAWLLLARQFRSPLVLILVFACVVSAFVGEGSEAAIIGLIIVASCALSFLQEYSAARAMAALASHIEHRALALRDGQPVSVPVRSLVPGDVVRLAAGNLVPADGVLLGARDCDVSEAILTGETFPVSKLPGTVAAEARLSERTNCVFAGTSVRSGTADMLVVATGTKTELAAIAASLARATPETEFAKGIRRFGYLMTEIMLAVVIVIFVANLLLHRPIIDSLLFSLALAVGLTPELLPAIIGVTLARGARTMARGGVIVRRLESIENLGSMDLLCTDKTGTLTEGVIRLDACMDPHGNVSADVRRWALLNATLQSGMANPLDTAIAASKIDADDLSGEAKVDEIPYDFTRRRLSVVVRGKEGGQDLLICKGAVENVVAACTSLRHEGADVPLDAAARDAIEGRVRDWGAQGYRALGVAIRRFQPRNAYNRDDETDLVFAGFLLFMDPPKPGMAETIRALASRGIGVKIITGDNRYVAGHLAEAVGIAAPRMMSGRELARLTKEALFARAIRTELFVEIDPNQKERIIAALRARGHVVGYLGDGINDAPALHEADIGISVDSAADVAREAADMVLLERDLNVLLRGIDDGRVTFANTMKYIATTTSANFGNMVSMSVASLFLPFLPLLASQILLNNFLSDLPSLAIATDRVDAEQLREPTHWDIRFVRRFMVVFGLVSSLFDMLTFGFLMSLAAATAAVFQTGWFVESLLTELAVVLIVRTRKAAWRSRPSPLLAWLTLAVGLLALAFPHLPVAAWFGFVPLPLPVMGALVAITLAFVAACEATKSLFFRHARRRPHRRKPVRRAR